MKKVMHWVLNHCFCTKDLGVAANTLRVIFISVCMFFFFQIVGTIEGMLWPVVEEGEITKIVPMDNDWTYIWGNSSKLRNCRFDHIEWFLGLPGDDVRVDIDIAASPVNRPLGPFEWGPWRILLTEDQIIRKSHATMFHRCHDITLFGKTLVKLWLTETPFWPKGENKPEFKEERR